MRLELRWSRLYLLLGIGEYLGHVDGPNTGSLAFEAAADVHETRVVTSGADFSLGIEDVPELVAEHGDGGVCVLHGEGPPEATTLLCLGQLDEIYALHGREQLYGRVADF